MLARMISGYGIEDSINEPRYYMEFNSKIYIEDNPNQRDKFEKIKPVYPNIEKKDYLHDYFGLLSAIYRPELTDPIQSVGDKHRDGSCLAY